MKHAELYIIDDIDLSIKDVYYQEQFQINLDEETNSKSNFIIPNGNDIKKDNFLVIKGLFEEFTFIVDEVSKEKNSKTLKVIAKDISNFFDKDIILKNESIMREISLESFLVDCIEREFINSDDPILNIPYIEIHKLTNTKAIQSIDSEDGIFNFHTFLINCRQYHNIYTDIYIENSKLIVKIENREHDYVLIDTTVKEVTDYNKVYEVDVLSKLKILVRETNQEIDYFLRTDRTITTDRFDKNRVVGKCKTISVDTLDKVEQEALNNFKSNRYNHLVEFSLKRDSKLVDVNTLKIGTPIYIKTDTIYESYISAITINNSDKFIRFKSGNIRIKLLDKIKKKKKVNTSKVDVSGGIINGKLQVNGNLFINGSEIENRCRNAITVYPGFTGMALNDTTIFPCNEIYAQAGENLTVENGMVKIGKGINHVLVSAQVTDSSNNNKEKNLYIYKNNTQVARAFLSFSGSSFQPTISIAQKLISVAEGDTISLWVYAPGTPFTGNENMTFLTVEAID